MHEVKINSKSSLSNFIQYSKKFMILSGVPDNRITRVMSGQSTFQEALHVRDFFFQEKIKSAIIVTDPYHLYRVRWTYKNLFPDGGVHFSFVASGSREVGNWWQGKMSREIVCMEVLKVFYYWMFHGIFRLDEDPVWATKLEKWCNELLRKYL